MPIIALVDLLAIVIYLVACFACRTRISRVFSLVSQYLVRKRKLNVPSQKIASRLHHISHSQHSKDVVVYQHKR